jgi:hypothetical protein
VTGSAGAGLDSRTGGAQHPGVSVAERIAVLCLDDKGHLPDNVYLAMAVRGAVLVDLAVAGRLAQTEDSIELDATPLGRPVPDRALAELDVLDGRSLDWWLEHSHLGLPEVADEQVLAGSWVRLRPSGLRLRPRFEEHAGSRTRDLALIEGDGGIDGQEDAAVVLVATAVHLGGRPGSTRADVLPRTGSVRWVVELVVDFLDETRARGIAVSSASQAALWSGSMPY